MYQSPNNQLSKLIEWHKVEIDYLQAVGFLRWPIGILSLRMAGPEHWTTMLSRQLFKVIKTCQRMKDAHDKVR